MVRWPPLLLLSLSAALLGATLIFPRAADACMAIGRLGPIQVRGEEAMIVWDPARRTEHFVRRADFRGVSQDFGFLVPTPSRPELLEVASGFFDTLFSFYAAPIPRGGLGGSAAGGGGDGSRAAGSRVIVLEQRILAGMEASVLAADDAGALAAWLRQHRYPSSPALTRWLAPYVANHGIITAFRVVPGQSSRFGIASVRMSFQTDRPYFPYSEPRGASRRPRPFRVSVIAPTRVRGVLARPGAAGGEPWSTTAGYAGQPVGLRRLESTVPQGSIPAGAWLTTFDEPRSRRGASDLYFEADPRNEPLVSTITTRIEP